ncbi:MAG: class I SAM-dependent methyltransferase [Bacteroidota bacterium]
MKLNTRIQQFYDQSTPLWLDIWGEHMHHGHYGADGKTRKDRVAAQIDMIETFLEWGSVQQATRILDAGCGVGGSARYLAKKYNAQAVGLTLSPVQKKHAERYTEKANLTQQVQFAVRDMMTLNNDDGQFDLVWSMESAEHIADKQQLFNRFYERLQPGGRLLMATWCHRSEPPELKANEKTLLSKIYDRYHLPPMVPIATLAEMAEHSGFKAIQTADWSKAVAPFWQKVIQSALTWEGLSGLVRSGWSTMRGAWAMQYMKRGFRLELIQFGVLSAEKQ